MLACLVLSNTMNESRLPFDPFEAKANFNRYFKGTYKEVFDRYCQCYGYDTDEVLRYYQKQAKELTRMPDKKKKAGNMDSFINASFRITK